MEWRGSDCDARDGLEEADALEDAIEELVARTITAAGVLKPPVDALVVARWLGIAVMWDDRQQGRARYAKVASAAARRVCSFECPSQPTILLRHDPRPERRQWALAHELGEHLAAQVFAACGIRPVECPPGAREDVANAVAKELLLPHAWFTRDLEPSDGDLLQLKQLYATASHEMIARRRLDLSWPAIITIFDQDKISFRRGNHGNRAPKLNHREHACWLACHETGRPCERANEQLRSRAWPIHEPGWKREIVCTEPNTGPGYCCETN